MKIDESCDGHIPIRMLWEVHRRLRLLSDDEAAHLPGCDRCLVALVICRISESLEEAEERMRGHLAAD
jgi:hypothetical protein